MTKTEKACGNWIFVSKEKIGLDLAVGIAPWLAMPAHFCYT